MTDLSEVKHLPTDAAQLIAPAALVPELDRHQQDDTRTYTMADVRACGGDHHAALLLGQLRYWWPRKYANHKGVKKSLSDWKSELALSRYEVERSTSILVRCGLIETYQDAWGRFRSPSTFYVLTKKAMSIKALANPSQVVTKALANPSQVTENTTSLTENEKTTPVDASPEATQSTPVAESKIPTAEMQPQTQKAEPSLTAVKKAPKILAWGKTFDDAVVACHGAPKVPLPEKQRELQNRNLKLMCRRMLAGGYTPEQVHDFLRWAGGEGWYTLRTEWGPYWNPDVSKKEQVPFAPDIGWLAGNPKTGSGANRLETALSIWPSYGGQLPQGEGNAACEQAKAEIEAEEAKQYAAIEAEWEAHKIETAAPVAKANAEYTALHGEKFIPEPGDTRLSVTDAWELILRSSALTPGIEIWRERIADNVPTPPLEEFMAKYSGSSEMLEIALALMPPFEAAEQPAAPTPEPEPQPVDCPQVSQVVKETPSPAPAVEPVVVHFLTADDYEECNEPPLASEKTPLTPEEKRKLSAAKDAANKIKGIKFTASAATMFQPKHVKASATA